jgi:hypothetical protein
MTPWASPAISVAMPRPRGWFARPCADRVDRLALRRPARPHPAAHVPGGRLMCDRGSTIHALLRSDAGGLDGAALVRDHASAACARRRVDLPRDLFDGLNYLARLAAYVQPTARPGPDAVRGTCGRERGCAPRGHAGARAETGPRGPERGREEHARQGARSDAGPQAEAMTFSPQQ